MGGSTVVAAAAVSVSNSSLSLPKLLFAALLFLISVAASSSLTAVTLLSVLLSPGLRRFQQGDDG